MRFWDEIKLEMIYDLEIKTDIGMFKLMECPNCIGMDFTGLIDNKKNNVYEGDILGGIMQGDYVQWCNECKSFEPFNQYNGCYACDHDIFWVDLIEDENLEVIGNIYQNPELLN
jgi:hypothetical protein